MIKRTCFTKLTPFIFCVILMVFLPGCVSIDKFLPTGTTTKKLDEKTIIAGLKEALEIGTKNAVKIVSKENGFLKNARISIPLPPDLKEWADRLRQIGLGSQVDKFISDMNHAAEKAAEKAPDIFVDAIKKMTLEDARNILAGADNAATQYFEKHTRKKLYGVFLPVVKGAMDKLGVTKLFKYLIDSYNKIPLVKKIRYDLDEYITNRGLDGLFLMLADEEKKIRRDPVARVTELLRTVFG
ncbi:MAG: DUF4197 domain-containing protein [Spirochaetales bacterium]|nr:DUF4197 domain-containing protein [Spirochaetales bacterium]